MESWKDTKIGTKCKASNWDGSGAFTVRSSVGKNKEKWATITGLSENRLFSHCYRGRLEWKYPALFIIGWAMEGKHKPP